MVWSVGLFAPFSGLTWLGEGERRYRLGGRWRVGEGLELDLTGERRQGVNNGQEPASDYRILLEGRFGY